MSKSSKAREIIERAIYDPDPFGVNKYQASQLVTWLITEAWDKQRREEIRNRASGMGYSMVDSLVIDDYDLVLWHSNKAQGMGIPSPYFVSINNAQHGPIDFDTQGNKQRLSAQRLPLGEIRRKLIEWVGRYDRLVIGSVIPKRNRLYWKMVRKLLPEYQVEPFYKNDLDYGFLLHK